MIERSGGSGKLWRPDDHTRRRRQARAISHASPPAACAAAGVHPFPRPATAGVRHVAVARARSCAHTEPAHIEPAPKLARAAYTRGTGDVPELSGSQMSGNVRRMFKGCLRMSEKYHVWRQSQDVQGTSYKLSCKRLAKSVALSMHSTAAS